MFLCTSIIFKYVLPEIWHSIINTIYGDFCSQFIPIGNNQSFCDDLTVDVTLQNAMWLSSSFIIMLLSIFFCINDSFKCSKHKESRYYIREQTDTWDYFTMKHRGAMRKSSTRNSINDTSTDFDVGVVLGKIPYSSISTE